MNEIWHLASVALVRVARGARGPYELERTLHPDILASSAALAGAVLRTITTLFLAEPLDLSFGFRVRVQRTLGAKIASADCPKSPSSFWRRPEARQYEKLLPNVDLRGLSAYATRGEDRLAVLDPLNQVDSSGWDTVRDMARELVWARYETETVRFGDQAETLWQPGELVLGRSIEVRLAADRGVVSGREEAASALSGNPEDLCRLHAMAFGPDADFALSLCTAMPPPASTGIE